MSPITTQDFQLQRKDKMLMFPIIHWLYSPRCGAEIWTVFGKKGQARYQYAGTEFRSGKISFNYLSEW